MTDLDDFISAYRGRISTLADDEVQPDVADVVDRARAIDEDALPAGLRESLPTSEAAVTSGRNAPELAPFAAAYRDRVEARADERRLSAVPSPSRRRRGLWIAVASIAAAAAVFIVIGRAAVFETASMDGPGGSLEEAERMLRRSSTDTGEVEVRRPDHAVSSAAPNVDEAIPEEPEPEPEIVPEPTEDPAKRATKKLSLDELEARAQWRWREGNLRGAESDLREVVRRAGRNRRAELAYGDLFSIARQRGGAAAQRKVWRQYLRRFPQGRFSDDVEGGLCRTAPSERRSGCWAKYLRHHPAGAHAAEARKVSGAGAPSGR